MSEALRVALVAGTLRVGGAEKQLFYMAEALSNAGAQVEVFSLGRPDEVFAERLREHGIPVWTMSRSRSRAVRVVRVVSAIRQFAPDLIQATHFFAGFYAIAAGLALRRPVIGAVRNNLLREAAENGIWTRWLYQMPSLLIVNSQAAIANTGCFGFDPARLRLVPNVISLEGWRQREADRHEHSGGRIVAIAVANLHHAKRLDRFIDALAIARRSYPHLQGVIVGTGVLEGDLKALAAACGLDDTILRFLGYRSDVNDLLMEADFACLTSSAEGTPNALLEAMATGLPVVATAVGDVPLLVDQGVSGYIVAENDIEGLAARMAELAASAPLRYRMGLAARERVERDFSPSALSMRLCDVYRAVAAHTGSAALRHKIERLAQQPS